MSGKKNKGRGTRTRPELVSGHGNFIRKDLGIYLSAKSGALGDLVLWTEDSAWRAFS